MFFAYHRVELPINDTPKEDKNLSKYALYKITGQPLYRRQKAGSQMCPLSGGSTVYPEESSGYVVSNEKILLSQVTPGMYIHSVPLRAVKVLPQGLLDPID